MVDRVFGTFGASAVLSLLLLAPAAMAERAAGVEYEFVDRPAGVPAEFQPGPDAGVRFLRITAIDGSRVDAALTQPKTKTPADSVLILSVHGSGGSFALQSEGAKSGGPRLHRQPATARRHHRRLAPRAEAVAVH
jgi:hypothetical protein